MKIGRNDRCPCGSGKKYKFCHENNPDAIPRDMSAHNRNLIILNAAEDIFGFRRGRSWQDFKKNISAKEVREFYEVQAALQHPDTNWAELMPSPDEKLRALYLGEIDPEGMARNLVRYSLYSDELFVVDPLQNPWHLQPEYNPLENPDQYKSDTIRVVLFLFQVAPWIRSGILKLIPDPSDFYPGLRQETWRLAKARWGTQKLPAQDLEEGHARGRAEMSRTINALPAAQLFRLAEKAVGYKLSDQQKADLLQYSRRRLEDDPLAYEQPLTRTGQLTVLRSGANLETALLILNLTGAFPYTSMAARWRELMSVRDQMTATARLWSPLTQAFQALEFRFLDNVDVHFAERIRQDGRLEAFRGLLRRVGKDAKDLQDESSIDSYVRDCKGELVGEYQKAQAEWSKIDEAFLRWASAGVGASLVSGHMWPDISSLSLAAANTVSQLLFRYMRQQQFRKANPMSVFIDLSKVEPPSVTLY